MRLRTPHDLLVRACTPYDFGQHLHTLPEQRPMAHTCPWCIQAHGAYRPMVHTGPWRIQAHGAYRPMVHTGPWCIQAHGAYMRWVLVPAPYPGIPSACTCIPFLCTPSALPCKTGRADPFCRVCCAGCVSLHACVRLHLCVRVHTRAQVCMQSSSGMFSFAGGMAVVTFKCT